MSNECVASGPTLGHVDNGSHFRLYYADPGQPSMCYGYSYQLQRNGYIYCPLLEAP